MPAPETINENTKQDQSNIYMDFTISLPQDNANIKLSAYPNSSEDFSDVTLVVKEGGVEYYRHTDNYIPKTDAVGRGPKCLQVLYQNPVDESMTRFPPVLVAGDEQVSCCLLVVLTDKGHII